MNRGWQSQPPHFSQALPLSLSPLLLSRQRRMDTRWELLQERLERQQLRPSLAVSYSAVAYDDMCCSQPLLSLGDIPPC